MSKMKLDDRFISLHLLCMIFLRFGKKKPKHCFYCVNVKENSYWIKYLSLDLCKKNKIIINIENKFDLETGVTYDSCDFF